jgi:dolichol-phosphate mannosyltransferase
MQSDSLVIIPTYNEKENIARMIHAVFSLDKVFHLLIVDDGSPDGTAEIVKKHQKEFPDQLHLLQRTGKLGLGTAYIAGFKWALERHYDYIYEMDCDFSHNPNDLPRLYKACVEGADLTVGSRYVKGGKVENWPYSRVLISYGGSLYARMITWMPVRDTTAGFVCYRRKLLETIDLDSIGFVGYAFQIEMKFAAYCAGFKITEIPITFIDRIEGASKMSKGIVQEAIKGVLMLKWRSFGDNWKRK